MRVEYAQTGYEAHKDQEQFAQPNVRAIVTLVCFILAIGCAGGIFAINYGPTLLASINPMRFLQLPGGSDPAAIAPTLPRELTEVAYGVSISEALPTFTPSETPLPTHTASPTPTATFTATMDYEATVQALQATNEALLSATPKADIAATQTAIVRLLETTPELFPTIAPVYEGYGAIIHNRTIIRSAAGQQYAPLFVESAGTVFPVLQRLSSGWTVIRLHDGRTGYVRSDLISFVADEAYQQQPTATPLSYIATSESTPFMLDISGLTPHAD